LTDARCIPGNEGCLVFIELSQYHLPSSVTYHGLNAGMIPYGIVLAPFCWRSGEWIGLTLVSSITHILRNAFESDALPSGHLYRLSIRNLLSSIAYSRESQASKSLELTLHPTETLTSMSKLCTEKSLVSSSLYSREIQTSKSKPQFDFIQRAMQSVVLVQAGVTWGSGIITDTEKGLVITCRHILTESGVLNPLNSRKKSYVPLTIHNTSLQTVYNKVDVLFATEADCSLDFALLRVKNSSFQNAVAINKQHANSNVFTNDTIHAKILSGENVKNANILPKNTHVKCSNIITNSADINNILTKGTDIFAIGYSTFGHHINSLPCITSGVISNICLVNGSLAILQTSAAVHCGGSGGAIISKHSGQLLGMVTCNIKDGNSSTSFPHVNFSIPVNVIDKLVELSMCDDGVRRSRELSNLISGSEKVWCLDTKQPAIKSKL